MSEIDRGYYEVACEERDRLRALLTLAHPAFCSLKCPAVGVSGQPIPHLLECDEMREAIAKSGPSHAAYNETGGWK